MHSPVQSYLLPALCTILSFSSLTSASHHHIKRVETPIKPTATRIPLTPQYFQSSQSKRVQVRYGPYTVPPAGTVNGLEEWRVKDAPKPCEDSCLVYLIHADLEYPDGSPANAGTGGLWLHHTVSTVANKRGLTCNDANHGDLFFLSGNERSVIDLSANGTQKVGYRFSKKDKMGTLTELMNMRDEPQTAYLTMTYEFIPGSPKDWEVAVPLRMDIAGCVKSHEVPLEQTTGDITFNSDPWTSDKNYRIVANVGHLQDGGVNHQTLRNGHLICDAAARYGETPAYVNADGTGMAMIDKPDETNELRPDTMHLSSMGPCEKEQGYLIPGDSLSVQSYYNLTAHPPMVNADGSVEGAMGMSFMWLVKVDADDLPLADRVRANAAMISQNARKNQGAWGSGFLVMVLVALLAFWLGFRRGGRRMLGRRSGAARAETESEAAMKLQEIEDKDYRD